MAHKLVTRMHVLRRTARSVAIAVCCSIAVTLVMCALVYGTDSHAVFTAGYAAGAALGMTVVGSALVSAGLSFRINRVMLELKAARGELWRLSRTDQLTGLLNRRGFDEAAIPALTKAHGASLPAVALMCDIDHFKAINDQFGHEFGDAVLVEISRVFSSFAKESEILIGRHGGEEFAALVTGAAATQAVQFAEALRKACADTRVSYNGASTSITISIGLSQSLDDTSTLPKMLRIADRALYIAKHDGRNRVSRADPVDDLVAA